MPLNRALSVLLIRHAESVAPGISGFDEYTRPLTAKGMRDACSCARRSRRCASTAPTRVPTCARVRLSSRLRRRAGSLSKPSRICASVCCRRSICRIGERISKRSWEDFDYAPVGGETSREAQARVVRVLDTVAARHSGGTVILASHGNLIALALNAFMPSVDYAFWESIPMPAVFTLIRDGDRWRCADLAGSESAFDPNLSLSEERPAKAAQRCRRERCNARQRTDADSFNHNRKDTKPARQQHNKFAVHLPALHLTRRSPFFTGSRRPPLGPGEVRSC